MARLVSIDIGTKSIKIVEGVSDKKNLTVKRAVTISTPIDSIQEGYIKDFESVRNVLKQTLTANGIRSKNAVFNINTSSLITRTVELPILKKHDETIQMIRFELEQFLPVVLDEYKIVFRVVKTYIEDGIKKGSYLIYAVPTKLINDYRQLADTVGLRLISMDLSFNSLEKVFSVGRNINDQKILKDKAYYVLEMGHKSLIFNVMYNDKNLFTRIINLGGADIDVSIGNLFDTNPENATKLKHKVSNLELYQLETPEDSSVNNVINTTVEEWISEVRRVVQYFISRNKEIEADKLFLYGGSSKIKNIEKFFQDNLSVKTETIDRIGGFSLELKSKDERDLSLVNYLNAIAGLLKTKSDMNLLSDILKSKQTRLINVAGGTIALGLIALALVFYFLDYSLKIYSLNNDIDYYDSIINNPTYQAKYNEVQELETKIGVLRDYKNIMGALNTQLDKTDVIQTDLLIALSSTVPIDTNISGMVINGSNINIQGTSIVRESIAQITRNLKDLDMVTNAHVPNIVRVGTEGIENYNFTVNITTKDVN
ncbi:MAG: Type IV pilus assembly protein PilM [Clostridiales bacterium 38_11]|nr:MAG: Type IV pilus assembly protein PilM [Clostridiales bacterium 38_11]